MISSSVVYGHSTKYSYEILHEYLLLMVISLLAYVAIFSDSFIFGKATSSHFFRVTFFKVAQESYFWSSSFFRAVAFFGEVLFQNSHFFSAFFFQNSYFFRVKLLPSNHILRIGNSLVQLPFGTATNGRYLQQSYFFEADSSAQHQLFQKSKILEKATFSENQSSRLPAFLESYLFNSFFINRYLLQQLFYIIPFQRRYFSTATLPINSH